MGESSDGGRGRQRMQTALAWAGGGAAGVLLSYALYLAVGEAYPKEPAAFVLFTLGAYGGMSVSDRLGPSAFRRIGLAAGVLGALLLVLVILVVTGDGP
jgi:hypothetical protein